MADIKAVFFDVDGVLLDSLPPHLAICRDLNIRYGLNLEIPTPDAFKAIARKGIPISPMEAFFRAVGFPEEMAIKGERDYRAEFADHYPSPLFQGVKTMLEALAEAHLPLGISTANTLANIRPPLKKVLPLFHPGCLFAHAPQGGIPKAEALREGARILGICPSELLFVGDQPSDHRASMDAGAPFLGVTYGWGISAGDTPYPTVSSPGAIARWMIDRRTP